MTDFLNLKRSYIAATEMGLTANAGYQSCKFANEFMHKLCETYVDNSNYCDTDKTAMKQELERLKESLSKQIEEYYQKRQ